MVYMLTWMGYIDGKCGSIYGIHGSYGYMKLYLYIFLDPPTSHLFSWMPQPLIQRSSLGTNLVLAALGEVSMSCGYPKLSDGWWNLENPTKTRTIYGGTPISGNLHIYPYTIIYSQFLSDHFYLILSSSFHRNWTGNYGWPSHVLTQKNLGDCEFRPRKGPKFVRQLWVQAKDWICLYIYICIEIYIYSSALFSTKSNNFPQEMIYT